MNDILTYLAGLTAKDESGLLPCPFSGKRTLPFLDAGGHGAKCPDVNCFCGRLRFKTRGDLLQRWHTRHREAALIALVQEAAGEISNLSSSLKDILSRFRSCIAQGNGEIEGDREAIVRAETFLRNTDSDRESAAKRASA